MALFGLTEKKNKIIYDFTPKSGNDDWIILNDGVMGGLSNSSITINEQGIGIFSGEVKLENNGGFASIRHKTKTKNVKNYSKISIKLKGDKKNYQLRLKKQSNDYYSYVKYFSTSGNWETITLNLNDLEPSFRGRKLSMKNFESDIIEELSILIANKKREKFKLEIDKIYLN